MGLCCRNLCGNNRKGIVSFHYDLLDMGLGIADRQGHDNARHLPAKSAPSPRPASITSETSHASTVGPEHQLGPMNGII